MNRAGWGICFITLCTWLARHTALEISSVITFFHNLVRRWAGHFILSPADDFYENARQQLPVKLLPVRNHDLKNGHGRTA
ncbi:hypothetical protein AV903_15410 [Erwinia tracheiphila]|uniref:Uncharacterized protein n=1 Tax=Erwinia tracheiphila TaxID=65700 RepID=A0A345CUH1_9GAMM|nr:hypothetical protein AV903_15410 [Erwinia tracheiphila]